jgi:hypothetical protein
VNLQDEPLKGREPALSPLRGGFGIVHPEEVERGKSDVC